MLYFGNKLVGIETAWAHRHCTPVSVSRGGCSCQFGRASAPMIPQLVHTMRGPNIGTGVLSGHGWALSIARWWQSQHDTSSDRTPLARMLPSVIGSPAMDRGRVLMPFARAVRYDFHWCRVGLDEGIVSKRLGAPYRSGPSRDWLKVKSPAMRRVRAGTW
jgi:hypothetical protein